jgi:hypothetical protein
MKTLLATIALGTAIISTEALAQDDHGSRGGWTHRDMTRQQAQQMADDMFQRFDANHDGVLTRQEAEQAAAQFDGSGHAERMIDRMFGDLQSLTLQQAEAQARGAELAADALRTAAPGRRAALAELAQVQAGVLLGNAPGDAERPGVEDEIA